MRWLRDEYEHNIRSGQTRNDVYIELPFESHRMKGKGQQGGKTGTSMWQLRGADKPRWLVP
jgi:hypothetical protein